LTPSQLRSEIELLITALYKCSLAIDSTKPVSVESPGGTIVTWSNQVELSSLFDIQSAFDLYAETLKNRWYSVMLFDGSLLQFSYTFSGAGLKKHRLSYQPCPIYIQPDDLEQFTVEVLVELIEGREFKDRVRLEGPLRFDYDMDAGAVDHPASHLTISRVSCRVPVMAPLSVGHFCKFLFSHFYPEQWESNEILRSWACSAWKACLPDLEEDRLFVSWRRG